MNPLNMKNKSTIKYPLWMIELPCEKFKLITMASKWKITTMRAAIPLNACRLGRSGAFRLSILDKFGNLESEI
jgi:hypothetical protein